MKKILLVEDDSKITLALGIRLRHTGYEVVTAPDAIGAMAQALKHAPDVVVLDINLPGGDGFLVAERLRSQSVTATVPVIFITASKLPGLVGRAKQLGAVAFLEKPFSASQLADALESALGEGRAAA